MTILSLEKTDVASPAVHKAKRRFFFTSDYHLFHEKILSFKDAAGQRIRPEFSSVEEMNEVILERHNARVPQGSRSYNLGDVFIGSEADFKKLWPKFTGSKSLILGNHDDAKLLAKGGFFRKIELWKRWTEFGMVFSHVPLHESGLSAKGKPLLNVHGHIHHNDSPDGPYLNVCVEKWDYRPVDMEELIEIRIAKIGSLSMPSLSSIDDLE